MERDGNGKNQTQWKKWETDKDNKILTKTVYKTKRTFIGLGVEDLKKYDELVLSGRKHIIFADRRNLPDMKPIEGTLRNFQATGNSDGQTIMTSELQCSCTQCRIDPTDIETCKYKDQRGEIKIHKVRDKNDIERENIINDPHGIKALKVKELREELNARDLPTNGNKTVLIERLTEFLDLENTVIEYDAVDSDEQDLDCDDIPYYM